MLITDQNGAVVEEYTLDLIDPSNRDKYESEGYTFQSGWQACNLTEVNASKFKSFSIDAIDAFYIAVKNAVKLGTLQASYTKSEYLGKVSEQIVEREALLGVSLTGLANSAFFFKHEEERASFLLKSLAEFAIVINKQFAKKIGINQESLV
jgi:ribonucleoside-diphosphate reductase alpha chain